MKSQGESNNNKMEEKPSQDESKFEVKDLALIMRPKYKSSSFRLGIVFIGCCILHFMTFGMHYSFGAMFKNLLDEFNAGQGKTGKIIHFMSFIL